MNRIVSYFIILFFTGIATYGQNTKNISGLFSTGNKQEADFSQTDSYVLGLKYDKGLSMQELTARIIKNSGTKTEKARAIFIWLANNISYDTSYKITSTEDALKQQKGVCQAYSGLFKSFCDIAGLECVTISGDSKQYYYEKPSELDKGGHAWNAIKVENDRWLLADATWGAGHVNNGKFTRRLSTEWFDPAPSIYIFSHLPKDAEWQLLKQPVNRETFLNLPPLYPNLVLWGFDADHLLSYFREHKSASFPEVYFPEVSCRILNMPVSRELKKGGTYEFEFILPDNSSIAIISNDKDWSNFQKNGNTYTCSFVPSKQGKAVLAIQQGTKSFGGVFKYTVR